MRRYSYDVLVVGAGGAGMMSACEASRHGARVAIAGKGKAARSGATIMAPGAIAAVGDSWKEEGDSRRLHMEDTIRGGSFVADQELVRIMCEEAPARMTELERMGSLFQRTEDGASFALRIDGGHSYPRCPFMEDRTGREMVRGMMSALYKRDVPIHEEVMIVRILKDGESVCGALGFDLRDLEPVLFDCRAVILATGGAGEMYANTDNSTDLTGDGYALALDAGAELRDMEFVQFYPIGMLWPPSLKGVLGALMFYSHLYNAEGERFMERYDPERLELSTRDRVSRAIVQEVMEGRGTPHGGVYCDLTYHEPGFLERMTPGLNKMYLNCGIDPYKDRFEIAPTCHFFMGGMCVDETWSSRVPGLYGAGEVCGGMHGGNRLSQNALAEILVSGHRAGQNAALFAKSAAPAPAGPETARELEGLLGQMRKSGRGMPPAEMRREIKELMWSNAGVIRSKSGLEAALGRLNELASAAVHISGGALRNRDVLLACENSNLLTTAMAVVRSALEREESRGAHYRSDHPDAGNELYNILVDRRMMSRVPVKTEYFKPEDAE